MRYGQVSSSRASELASGPVPGDRAPKEGRPAPYEDEFDEATGRFAYRFRDPARVHRSPHIATSRQTIGRCLPRMSCSFDHFRGIAPKQYAAVAPVFVTAVDHYHRLVEFEVALPVADTTARLKDRALGESPAGRCAALVRRPRPEGAAQM